MLSDKTVDLLSRLAPLFGKRIPLDVELTVFKVEEQDDGVSVTAHVHVADENISALLERARASDEPPSSFYQVSFHVPNDVPFELDDVESLIREHCSAELVAMAAEFVYSEGQDDENPHPEN